MELQRPRSQEMLASSFYRHTSNRSSLAGGTADSDSGSRRARSTPSESSLSFAPLQTAKSSPVSSSSSQQDLCLFGLEPAQQTVAICQVLAQLREDQDWTALRLYLALVGRQMSPMATDVGAVNARGRVGIAAQAARCLVDESMNTVSLPSLRPWAARAGRSSFDDALRLSREGSANQPDDVSVPVPVPVEPRPQPASVKVPRMRRVWRLFCAFLDSGPPSPRR